MKRVMQGLVMAGLLVLGWSAPAHAAVPAIDGVVGAGEWLGALFFGTDPNEAFQGDAWDLKDFTVLKENSGGAEDGLYFLFRTYGAPTFAGEPPRVSSESKYIVFIDFDGDGTEDQVIIFNGDQLGGVNVAGGVGALGPDGVELFVPEASLTGTVGSNTQVAAQLDNGGRFAEDDLPDAGFLRPIPEPASASLFGLGLLGAAYVRKRRKRS